MIIRLLNTVIVLAVAVGLLILTWPQLFDLQNSWLVAQAVSLRGLGIVVACAAIILLLVIGLIRPLRALAGTLAALLLAFAITNGAILGFRGFDSAASAAASGESEESAASGESGASGAEASSDPANNLTVLSWNTLGDAPGAAVIADLAIAEDADVIALPETTEITGTAVADALAQAGKPMQVLTIAFDLVSQARSTTLLVSTALGDYAVSNDSTPGAPGNTAVLPTVVATPVDGIGPTLVAVHSVAPVEEEMANWRVDLDWLATQCLGADVIMAGDFNATVDHMAGRGASASLLSGMVLGNCRDAGVHTHSAGIGTWPATAPAMLGTPIDHVLATGNWTFDSLTVIQSLDDAGSDHRPIVARMRE